MLKFAIISLFVIVSSAQALTNLEAVEYELHQNQCVRENLISPIHSVFKRLYELKEIGFYSDSESVEERAKIASDLISLAARIKEIKLECNLAEIAASLKDDWLQSAGYLFLTASNCFKDVGAELLILDSVINSFKDKNYTQGLFQTLALGLLGYQGYQDCKPLVDFFRKDSTNEFSVLGEPNNLGGCSVWGITGCGAAVAAAGLTCGELGPGAAACIIAAISAIPGCGVCLCQSINCPKYCPCG